MDYLRVGSIVQCGGGARDGVNGIADGREPELPARTIDP